MLPFTGQIEHLIPEVEMLLWPLLLLVPLPWPVLTPSLGIHIGLVAAWVLLLVVLAEAIQRYTTWGNEVARKVVHLGTGNLIVLAWWLDIPALLGVLAAGLFSALTLVSYRYPVLASVSGVGRQSWGTFFYAVSIGLLMACFWTPATYAFAAMGILIMTWGDGLAALIGQKFGQHGYRLWGIQKSWEGSLTMAAVSFAVCAGVLSVSQGLSGPTWLIAGLVGIVAMGLEAFSKYGIDNLTVPLGSAWLGYWLCQWQG